MRSLKRAVTTAMRKPLPSKIPFSSVIVEVQLVAELVALRPEVFDVRVRRLRLQRYPLDDRQVVALDAGDLHRVVAHEAHRLHAEIDEDLRADTVVAKVRREAECFVGFHRVEATLLQFVRLELVTQTDTTTL